MIEGIVATLELVSDTSPKTGPDFDIRNATFSSSLTNQLVFYGTQWIALTSVSLTRTGDWWNGMLAQTAHVTLSVSGKGIGAKRLNGIADGEYPFRVVVRMGNFSKAVELNVRVGSDTTRSSRPRRLSGAH